MMRLGVSVGVGSMVTPERATEGRMVGATAMRLDVSVGVGAMVTPEGSN